MLKIGKLKKTVVEMEWTIPDFLSISENKVESPHFSSCDSLWSLTVVPNREQYLEDETSVSVYLKNLWETPSPLVDFSLSVKSATGEKLYEKSFIHSIVDECGCYDLFPRSELLNRKDSLLPDGALTIVCSLKGGDPSTVARTEKLSRDFEMLLSDKTNADVIVKVEAEEFRLHKSVLCTRTSYFAAMFKHDMQENATNEVTLNDCKADTFRLFVSYLYTGRAELTPTNIYDLFKLADMLQVVELKNDCLDYIKAKLTVDTFCDTVSLVLIYNDVDLLERVRNFLAKKMLIVMKSEKWEKFLYDNPIAANKLLMEAVRLRDDFDIDDFDVDADGNLV